LVAATVVAVVVAVVVVITVVLVVTGTIASIVVAISPGSVGATVAIVGAGVATYPSIEGINDGSFAVTTGVGAGVPTFPY